MNPKPLSPRRLNGRVPIVSQGCKGGIWVGGIIPNKSPYGCCQNYGTFLGTLNNRCRIIIGTPKGTINLTTTHMQDP